MRMRTSALMSFSARCAWVSCERIDTDPMESAQQRAGNARAGLVEGFGTGSVDSDIAYDVFHAYADSHGPGSQDLTGAAHMVSDGINNPRRTPLPPPHRQAAKPRSSTQRAPRDMRRSRMPQQKHSLPILRPA